MRSFKRRCRNFLLYKLDYVIIIKLSGTIFFYSEVIHLIALLRKTQLYVRFSCFDAIWLFSQCLRRKLCKLTRWYGV